MNDPGRRAHAHQHAFIGFRPLQREGLTLLSRRNMLKAGLAGLAGLSLPDLLRQRAAPSRRHEPRRTAKVSFSCG